MASINYAAREISVKIVYYGPGLSGKTTNLQVIHKKVPPNHKSDMVSLATETDRTLFFDFLPLDLGKIKGFATKFQLYTVPGQVYYNATRKLVLRGVDGVVFVADSGADKIQENLESFQNLEDNLAEYGYERESIPIIIQYNKRDLPNALPIEELQKHVNKYNLPIGEAVAYKGVGVFDTLKQIGKIVIDFLNKKYSKPSRRGASQSQTSAPRPQAPSGPQYQGSSMPRPQGQQYTPPQPPQRPQGQQFSPPQRPQQPPQYKPPQRQQFSPPQRPQQPPQYQPPQGQQFAPPQRPQQPPQYQPPQGQQFSPPPQRPQQPPQYQPPQGQQFAPPPQRPQQPPQYQPPQGQQFPPPQQPQRPPQYQPPQQGMPQQAPWEQQQQSQPQQQAPWEQQQPPQPQQQAPWEQSAPSQQNPGNMQQYDFNTPSQAQKSSGNQSEDSLPLSNYDDVFTSPEPASDQAQPSQDTFEPEPIDFEPASPYGNNASSDDIQIENFPRADYNGPQQSSEGELPDYNAMDYQQNQSFEPQAPSGNPQAPHSKTDLDMEIEKYQREIEEKQKKMRTSQGQPPNDDSQEMQSFSSPADHNPYQSQQSYEQVEEEEEFDVFMPEQNGDAGAEEGDDAMYFTSVDRERHKKPVKRPVNPKTKGQQHQKGFLKKLFNKDNM